MTHTEPPKIMIWEHSQPDIFLLKLEEAGERTVYTGFSRRTVSNNSYQFSSEASDKTLRESVSSFKSLKKSSWVIPTSALSLRPLDIVITY